MDEKINEKISEEMLTDINIVRRALLLIDLDELEKRIVRIEEGQKVSQELLCRVVTI